MDELLQAIMELKLMARKQILKYPATYHALDVVESIAGWERAAMGDKKMDLAKTIRKIYQEQADILR